MPTPITDENLPEATLDDWADEFWKLYEKRDRSMNLLQMWAEAWKQAADVGEAIREGNLIQVLEPLAHAFVWVAPFATKLKEDDHIAGRFRTTQTLSDMVFSKYPRLCSTCHSRTCVCSILWGGKLPRVERIKARMKANITNADMPGPLDEWGDMFATIFDKAHFIKHPEDLGFHFLEEMGEVEEAVQKIATWPGDLEQVDMSPYSELHLDHLGDLDNLHASEKQKRVEVLRFDLFDEIADTVSWMFSIVRKIDVEAKQHTELRRDFFSNRSTASSEHEDVSITMSTVLKKFYLHSRKSQIVCPTCDDNPCTCPPRDWIVTREDEEKRTKDQSGS